MSASLVDKLAQITNTGVSHASDVLKGPNLARGFVTAFVGYLLLVRALRYKRYHDMHRRYQKKYEERTLTPEEAQKIMRISTAYDMPLLLNYSLAFALFKTYAIVGCPWVCCAWTC